MENRNNSLYLLLATIFPISGFVYASTRPKILPYKSLLIIFFTFIGIVFLPTAGGDVFRYVEEFQMVAMKKITLMDYYNSRPEVQQIDYYTILMTWILSRFTSNPHIYLGILALVPTVFLAQNVSYISKKCSNSSRFRFFLFILVITPNIMFLTHRWWTALQIFLYGMLPYILDGKSKRLWFCLLSIGVHFSFIFSSILLSIYAILPKKIILPYLIVFIITYFVSTLNFDFISDIVNQILPVNYADRSTMYLSKTEDFKQGWAHVVVFNLHNILNLIFAMFIFFRLKIELKNNASLRKLLIIALMMASFAQLSNRTDWGWRYFDLSNFLFTCLFTIIAANRQTYMKLKTLFKYSYPFFLFFLIVFIRFLFSIISPTSLLVGNYFTTWFFDEEISVLEYIKLL
ncbi:MAG: EpsG family protein [Butyricimonas virosa]